MGKEKKEKKHKKDKKKHKKKYKSSSDSDSSADEWVEKPSSRSESPKPKRDEWLSLPTNFAVTTNEEKKLSRAIAKQEARLEDLYNPSTNSRELNPYWKDGGSGLPSQFKKPTSNDNSVGTYKQSASYRHVSSWRKKPTAETVEKTPTENVKTTVTEIEEENLDVLSDKELNKLASKVLKAEIMGNHSMAKELQAKLDKARKVKAENPHKVTQEKSIILTETDSRGFSRPLKQQSDFAEPSNSKNKKQKVETHKQGERMRYFADDDNYSLKEMFENEKFHSIEDQNKEFLKMAGKVRKNDDMDDIFSDNIRKKESDSKSDQRNKDRAIGEHQRVAKSLDNCNKCLQSDSMPKHLMVSMGNAFYLSLPPHEPLTEGHCLLIPTRHCTCSTQLDENEWEELMDFRKSLCKMFGADDEDPIFFETACGLNRFPHMQIHCVPLPKETGDLAPIYFKKAIDESETEWATNRKLVSLAGRDVRRAIPKGLPYFSVSFGLQEGYAHVIEDEKMFPNNFAQEIIGGMLDLDHVKWRKPKRQRFEEQSSRVVSFTKLWAHYDHTKN